MQIVQAKGVVEGRKLRVDTNVVETNIHFPTDSVCWTKGFGCCIRKITKLTGQVGTKMRDSTRSVGRRLREIARMA